MRYFSSQRATRSRFLTSFLPIFVGGFTIFASPGFALDAVVSNLNEDGTGSLRQAINQANRGGGTVRFNLAGTGPFLFFPSQPLPALQDGVTIDGFSQPGSQQNTVANGSNARLPIVLDGTRLIGTSGSQNGLEIAGANNRVRGLIIRNFSWSGIALWGARSTRNVVAGCWVGTDSTGDLPMRNQEGISLRQGANRNLIGGTSPGERNVLSGNGSNLYFFDGETNNNRVEGNFIGLNAAGNAAVSTPFSTGIFLGGGLSNTIGGETLAQGNVIAGQGTGIYISNPATRLNKVLSNRIGIAANGTPLGNAWDGIVISNGAQNNKIGWPGAGNLIANNGGNGVVVEAPDYNLGVKTIANSIRGNSLKNNGGLGIDLRGANGNAPNANDPQDVDGGANEFQNFPVIKSARVLNGGSLVECSLSGAPNQNLTFDLYASSKSDPSGFGEGERYLGTRRFLSDATGNTGFQLFFPAPVRVGEVLTATTTDEAGNTSEFCLAVPVQKAQTTSGTASSSTGS